MDPIARFEERLYEAFEVGARSKRLAQIGGNFTFVVHGKAAWSVYTKGPKAGVVEGVADEVMDFVMIVTPEVFERMYDAAGGIGEVDAEQIVAGNKLAMFGDPQIFFRYLALNAGQNMLALRGGGGSAVKSSAKKARRSA